MNSTIYGICDGSVKQLAFSFVSYSYDWVVHQRLEEPKSPQRATEFCDDTWRALQTRSTHIEVGWSDEGNLIWL
jgi:hypothetical protein